MTARAAATARDAPTRVAVEARSSAQSVSTRRSLVSSSLNPKSINKIEPSLERKRFARRRSRCVIP